MSNDIHVSEHIKKKRDAANDVAICIDANKDHLVLKVPKQDLNDLSECVYHGPPNDEGEDLSAIIFLLRTCSWNDYMTIADSILTQFDVCKNKLLSFYHMAKQRPNFVEMQLNDQKFGRQCYVTQEANFNHPILEEATRSQPIVVNQQVLVGKLEVGYEAGMKIILRK